MKWLDELLDRVTMYRLLLYYLLALLAAAVGLSAVGLLHLKPADIVFSAAFLTALCWIANQVFSRVLEVPSNPESSIITALILALIITPTSNPDMLLFLAAAGGLAIASKYLLTYKRRHIFNPAAIAVVLTSIGARDAASWWVGTAWMLPFVLVGGVLVARRIRRLGMVMWFAGSALVMTALLAAWHHTPILATAQKEIVDSALFFAGFVMLTEPLTSPTTKTKQKWYSVLVGALFPPQLHLGGLYSTPELALIAGNVFSFIVTPRTKLLLRLKERVQLTADSYDYVFTPSEPFAYRSGQYMEFTLPHASPDSRGARRYFTLASSPTEPDVHVGVKFHDPSSSYKQAMQDLGGGRSLTASQLSGDFTLPEDPNRKLVFIAGGIGITPFRSMLKYLVDNQQRRDIVVLYSVRSVQDIAYHDDIEAARRLGVKVFYLVRDVDVQPPFYSTRLSSEFIQQVVPDYKERLFYVSGSHSMVVDTGSSLRKLGVRRRNIKKDFFSGYA